MIDLLSDYCKKIELDITDTQLQQFDELLSFFGGKKQSNEFNDNHRKRGCCVETFH